MSLSLIPRSIDSLHWACMMLTPCLIHTAALSGYHLLFWSIVLDGISLTAVFCVWPSYYYCLSLRKLFFRRRLFCWALLGFRSTLSIYLGQPSWYERKNSRQIEAQTTQALPPFQESCLLSRHRREMETGEGRVWNMGIGGWYTWIYPLFSSQFERLVARNYGNNHGRILGAWWEVGHLGLLH